MFDAATNPFSANSSQWFSLQARQKITLESFKTQCFFIQLLQKLNHRYALICSNSGPNLKAIQQSTHKLERFEKCCKKEKKKKQKENKTNFEGAYLGNGLVDSAQIWNFRYPTPRKFAQNILCVSAQGVSSYRCVKKAHFLLL